MINTPQELLPRLNFGSQLSGYEVCGSLLTHWRNQQDPEGSIEQYTGSKTDDNANIPIHFRQKLQGNARCPGVFQDRSSQTSSRTACLVRHIDRVVNLQNPVIWLSATSEASTAKTDIGQPVEGRIKTSLLHRRSGIPLPRWKCPGSACSPSLESCRSRARSRSRPC